MKKIGWALNVFMTNLICEKQKKLPKKVLTTFSLPLKVFVTKKKLTKKLVTKKNIAPKKNYKIIVGQLDTWTMNVDMGQPFAILHLSFPNWLPLSSRIR